MSELHLPPDYAARMRLVATRIREVRKAKGMTQEELWQRAGVSRGTVQNLEAGRFDTVPNFTIDSIHAIAYALEIELSELFA